jgi:predicted protein tyrosine phosphatase
MDRSPTAEKVFKHHPGFTAVRSAGTARYALTRVTAEMLEWADEIFVMERIHRHYLWRHFFNILRHKRVVTLNIPDDFVYGSPHLIRLLRRQMKTFL